MKQRIPEQVSDLMDGELEQSDAERTLSALREEGEARQAWRTYHLIGDALRDTRMLSSRFAVRMAASLAEEPTVLAPAAAASVPERSWRRYVAPAAAAMAAAGFVGAVAFMVPMQEAPVPGPQIAQAPAVKPVPATQVTEPSAPPVPLPAAADDYLLAHQGYSPRNRLQGVAPYVRTVSGQALESKR